MSSALEKELGSAYLAFNSVHNAVQACVEILGSRSHMIVAVVPVTISSEILAGIMRGGAHPMMLDTDKEGVFYDPEVLAEALEALDGAALVFLPRTARDKEPEAVSALLEGVPTVAVNYCTPGGYDFLPAASFEIYHLSPWVDQGAVVRTEFAEQLEDLRRVRSGALGLAAKLPLFLDQHAAEVGVRPTRSVPASRKPLHLEPEIARRWVEAPSYPNAESAYERTSDGCQEKEEDDQ